MEHLPRDRRASRTEALAAALLRPDRFYPVSGEELLDFRDGFLEGKRQDRDRTGTVPAQGLSAFLDENAASIAAFKSRQQAAFEAERARWQETAQEGAALADESAADDRGRRRLPLGATAVESPVPGSVWKILVEPGREVSEGETLIIVELMKMEIAVARPSSGIVREVRCAEGRAGAARPGTGHHGGARAS